MEASFFCEFVVASVSIVGSTEQRTLGSDPPSLIHLFLVMLMELQKAEKDTRGFLFRTRKLYPDGLKQ